LVVFSGSSSRARIVPSGAMMQTPPGALVTISPRVLTFMPSAAPFKVGRFQIGEDAIVGQRAIGLHIKNARDLIL
jgi:hypothetical protein